MVHQVPADDVMAHSIHFILYLCRILPGVLQGSKSRDAHQHFYDRVGSEE